VIRQKALDHLAAIDVGVFAAFQIKALQQLARRQRACFEPNVRTLSQRNLFACEDDNAQAFVWPRLKASDLFLRVSSHDQNVDGAHEFCIATIFAGRKSGIRFHQSIDRAVFARDETVKADCHVHGSGDRHVGTQGASLEVHRADT
jgi:hypothetical protein